MAEYEKVLRAKHHPPELSRLVFKNWSLSQIRFLPHDEWIINRMNQFGYEASFDKHGMMFPIAVSNHTDGWVKRRIIHQTNDVNMNNVNEDMKTLVPGYYVHVGNKRVWWAKENGYTHIEGYLIRNTAQRQAVKRHTYIPHEKIPK